MPLKESEAIVLRSFPLGEGDRIVSFLDRQVGRVRGVAKGARRLKSRFGSTLEPLSYIRIWYFERENRNLVQINQCELLESFLDVQQNYESGIGLALISEVNETVLDEMEPAEAQFRLNLLTARAIRTHGPLKVIFAYFCLWTCKLSGWLGSFEYCSSCGVQLGTEGCASMAGGGISCAKCRRGTAQALSNEGLSLGRAILSWKLEDVVGSVEGEAVASGILSYALDVLEYHIEKKLLIRQMLNSIENNRIEI